MSTFAQYLHSIMVVAIISGVVSVLAPKDSSGGKYVNFACALVIVVVIATPLLRLVDVNLPEEVQAMIDFATEEEGGAGHNHAFLHYSREYLARNTTAMLAQRFRIAPDDVTLYFDIERENDTHIIRHLRVDLHTLSAIFRTEDIRTFLADLFGVDVEMVEVLR
ncbi:MAG: stage III sporulation protein AF [Oscillospiraceae bacterium]|nr:stage III sporulation protein AF [Oscillospiraceae bacterium]